MFATDRIAHYNLRPSQFVEMVGRAGHRPLVDILADLAATRAERERTDADLAAILSQLGYP